MIMHSCNVNSRIAMQERIDTDKLELVYCPKCTYKLMIRGVGSYASDNIIHLWWIILCHRLHHFFKGEGFRD